MSRTPLQAPTPVRCAIYTRKSTEEGLAQEFNSLDAQREAAEAYIKSQQQEGWICLAARYDDGGFTGGNIERPALQELLAAIEAGGIDCVVVYKVDRLSRSLLDFARLMEVFERQGVSFVSVTQQFSTTNSMGRLTLNILLSFAQFEREIISERTRDKMAATRRKGKWAGGPPVLGYDVIDRKLIVNEPEAERVRGIFELYLRSSGLIPLVRELERRGWRRKQRMTRAGVERGGGQFNKTALHALLTNVTYIGKVRHKEEIFEGEHAAILDGQLFEAVQKRLKQQRTALAPSPRVRAESPLQGILRCAACDCAMASHYSTNDGRRRYRYYVCSQSMRRGRETCPQPRLPAGELERLVVEQLFRNGAVSENEASDALATRRLQQLVERIEYDGRTGALAITLRAQPR